MLLMALFAPWAANAQTCEPPTSLSWDVREECGQYDCWQVLTLSWDGDCNYYNLERKLPNEQNWQSLLTNYYDFMYEMSSTTDLFSEGTQFRVQGVCDEGVTDWVTTTYSTTPYCEAPYSIDIEQPMEHCWTLVWQGGSGTYEMEIKWPQDDYWSGYFNYGGGNSCDLSFNPFEFEDIQFRVRSVCEDINMVSDWVTYTYMTCYKPTNLAVEVQDAYNAIASWSYYSGTADHLFNIEVNGVVTENVTEPYTIHTEPSTSYTVRVQKVCADGDVSSWSDEVSFTTPTCPAPYDLSMLTYEEEHWESPLYEGGDPIITTVTIYELNWLGEGTSGVYNVETKTASDEDWTVLATNYNNTYIYVDGPFNVSTQFRVQSVCGDNVSEWVTYTEPSWCSMPSNLTINDQDAFNVIVSWEYTSSTNRSFNIEVNGVVTVNVTSPYVIETEPSTTYTVRLQAVCSADAVSDWTEEVSFTTPVACQTPTGFQVFITEESIIWANVYWDDVQGASSYDVEVNGVIVENQPDYDYDYYDVPIDLESNTTYTVRVRAVCSNGYVSDWTEPEIFTIECQPSDRCAFEIELTDSSGNGWNEGIIQAIDVATGDLLMSFAASEGNPTNTTVDEYENFYVCYGTEVQFVWNGPTDNFAQYNIVISSADYFMGTYSVEDEIVSGNPSILPFSFSCEDPCPKPTEVTVNYTGGTQAIVSWVSEASNFYINVNGVVTYNVTNPYTLTNLESSTTYEIKVGADCGSYSSGWSEPVSFTTPECMVPMNFSVGLTEESYFWFDIYWDGVPGASFYDIEINGVIVENVAAYGNNDYYDELYYDVEGSTTYTIRMRTVCSNGNVSDWTEPDIIITPCNPNTRCAFEIELTDSSGNGWDEGIIQAIDVATGDILMSFTASDGTNTTVDEYEDFYVCSGTEVQFVWNGPTDNFAQYNIVISSADYFMGTYSVEDEIVSGNPSILPFRFNCEDPCPKPTEIIVNYTGGTEATVSWVSEASNFYINVNGVVTYNVTNPYALTNLESSTTYEIKVGADCGSYSSGWSEPVSFTTPECMVPMNFVVGITEEAFFWFDIYWDGVPGASSYDIEINGVIVENVAAYGNNNYYDELYYDVEPSTTYTIRMRTVCSNGNVSDWTEPDIIITPECQPEDRCEFELELTDASGNGWDAGILQVLDIATGDVLLNFPACEANVGNNPASRLVGFYVCTDHEFQLVWNGPTDNMEQYTFEFREAYAMWGVGNGDMICSGNPARLPFDYGCGVTCRRPTNIAAESLGDYSVELSWYCDSYTEDYNISVNGTVTNNISAYEDIDYPGMFTYTLNGLDANTAYEVKLQAICDDDNVSNWSDSFNFSMGTCLPEEMCYLRIELRDSSCDPGFDTESLRVVDVTTGFILGKYGYSPNIMYCDPEYYSLQVCDGHELKFISSSAPSTAYYTVVDADGEVVFFGQGPLSEPGYYTVNCPTCFKPTGLEALEVGRTSALLSWTENGDAESWIVAYNQPDVNNDGYIEVVAESIPFTLEGLVTEATTLVKVRPICSDGEEKWSDVIDFWTPACPDVTNLSVFPSPTSGIVSWDTYPGDEYYVDYALYSDDGTAGLDWNYGSESVTSPYTIDGLEPETQYIVRVRTTCPGYGSTNGVEVLFTTLSEEVVQELTMVAGTNWYTFEVDITLQELQEALVAAMDAAGVIVTASNPIIIKTKSATTKYNGVFWRGNLTSLDANEMYMITLPASGEITLQGPAVIPEETYTIHYGANWIVFPAELSSMSLVDAFTGFAVVGDKIKLKGATATFNGTIWRGNFNTLEPGECYIYISNVDNDRTLVFPSTSK